MFTKQCVLNYVGLPDMAIYRFDAALVESVICNLSRGKATGLDNISAEHLQFCHALLPVVLAMLFNLMIKIGYVPGAFSQSYTVPLLKDHCNAYVKSVSANDFRGISISPVISKVFEHCILERYGAFFVSSDYQFGFKKRSSCAHATYTLRCVIDYFVSRNSTVNLCAVDLSKAFDKMSHHGLFIKLMDRCIPVSLLRILEVWFERCTTCIKWGSCLSKFYKLNCGIRQGGVLSPYLFAVYVDSVIDKVRQCGAGCKINMASVGILLYADDILLVAPTVTALQTMLHVCETELSWLDMTINPAKSVCLRIGPNWKSTPVNISTLDGSDISWQQSCRYLGIHIVAGRVFSCSLDNAKRSFYRAFNAVYCKIGGVASEEVVLHLVKSKCMPLLLYGTEAIPIKKAQIRSVEYAITCCLMKLFKTKSKEIVCECMSFFNFCDFSTCVVRRKRKFLLKFVANFWRNELCCVFVDVAKAELNSLR